jgi:hypothetical protein
MKLRSSSHIEFVIIRESEGFAEVEQPDGDIDGDAVGPVGGVVEP